MLQGGNEWLDGLVRFAIDVHADIWPCGKNLFQGRNGLFAVYPRVG